jgi:hypothetical protein
MTWGFVAIAGATLVGAKISSSAATKAAEIQVAGAEKAGDTSLEIANLQIGAQNTALDKQLASSKEALALQLAADKENIDKQITLQKDTLTQTLAAQTAAAAAGQAAAAAALDKQIAAQKEALDAQLKLQRELFNKQVENLSSFKQAGETGQAKMMDLLGLSGNTKAPGYGSAATAFKVEGFDPNTLFEQFNAQEMEQDPGYAFRLSEGQKAIERSTAAKTGLQSGAALKAAARFGQEMGSQEYQNAFNRFQANKAFQAQEYGNAFNRFTTERSNMLAPLQALTASGQASAAGQAAAAGNFASGASQALQGYGAGTSAAYGNYGATASDIAARTGAGASAAYGNYGAGMSNTYASSSAARQSAYGQAGATAANAYGNLGSNLTNIYGQQGTNTINAITGAANARAAGQIGSANAFTNALGQGVNLYGMYNQNQLAQQYINRMPPTGSDAAIKENIRKIGVLDNGLNVYSYEYKAPYKDMWGHGQQIGVMAQEVEQIIPKAVSVHPDGYKMVDYSMIH